jgi:hypothetical protein
LEPKQEIEMILRRTEGRRQHVSCFDHCGKLPPREAELRDAVRIHVCAAFHARFRTRARVWQLRCGEPLTESASQANADHRRRMSMTLTKVLGLAATGALLVLAMPAQHATAMSLINPGAAAVVQDNSQLAGRQMTTEVHWRHSHWHGGYHGRWHRWHHRHW